MSIWLLNDGFYSIDPDFSEIIFDESTVDLVESTKLTLPIYMFHFDLNLRARYMKLRTSVGFEQFERRTVNTRN